MSSVNSWRTFRMRALLSARHRVIHLDTFGVCGNTIGAHVHAPYVSTTLISSRLSAEERTRQPFTFAKAEVRMMPKVHRLNRHLFMP
jgi:hypothetical protein